MKFTVLAAGLLLWILAACDDNNFSSKTPAPEPIHVPTEVIEEPTSETMPAAAEMPPQSRADGRPEGHFDLDAVTEIYAIDKGAIDRHGHDYDDEYGVTGVDILKLLDGKFVDPTEDLGLDQPLNALSKGPRLRD